MRQIISYKDLQIKYARETGRCPHCEGKMSDSHGLICYVCQWDPAPDPPHMRPRTYRGWNTEGHDAIKEPKMARTIW